MQAPHNGTGPSIDAARSLDKILGKLQAEVLNHVRSVPEGATCDEIEIALGLKHQTASARLNDLMKLGRVQFKYDAAGKALRRLTRSGRGARIYYPTP
jgi:hypothetical protein